MAADRSTTEKRRAANVRREWHDEFLAHFLEIGTITGAAKATGVDRRTVQLARQRDEEFALKLADAEEQFTEKLERVAYTRAVDGSDRLVEFLLKARRPDRYRENVKIEHSGQIAHDLSALSDDELRRVADGLDAVA